MLRREVGDKAFLAALGRFWREQRLPAGLLRRPGGGVLCRDRHRLDSRSSRRGWGVPARRVWRSPGPRSRRAPDGEGYQVELTLEQVQREEPFPLTVPVVVTVAAGPPVQAVVRMQGRTASLTVRDGGRAPAPRRGPGLRRHAAPRSGRDPAGALHGAWRGRADLRAAGRGVRGRAGRLAGAASRRGSRASRPRGWSRTASCSSSRRATSGCWAGPTPSRPGSRPSRPRRVSP